jgi:hypothetical protein
MISRIKDLFGLFRNYNFSEDSCPFSDVWFNFILCKPGKMHATLGFQFYERSTIWPFHNACPAALLFIKQSPWDKHSESSAI